MTQLAENEYRVPFHNRRRVIPRGLWSDRIDREAGLVALENKTLCDFVVMAVAFVHDDELVTEPIVGFRVNWGEEIFEHNFRLEEGRELPKIEAMVSLMTQSGGIISFSIEGERNGDIVMYRQ